MDYKEECPGLNRCRIAFCLHHGGCQTKSAKEAEAAWDASWGGRLKDEHATLREENRRLKDALTELVTELKTWRLHFGKPGTVPYQRVEIICDEAAALLSSPTPDPTTTAQGEETQDADDLA